MPIDFSEAVRLRAQHRDETPDGSSGADFDRDSYNMATLLLKSGHLSDITIKCDDMTFAVHKAILYPQSPFLQACIDKEFREKASNEIELKETTPQAVAMLLLMVYAGDDGLHLELVHQMWPGLKLVKQEAEKACPEAQAGSAEKSQDEECGHCNHCWGNSHYVCCMPRSDLNHFSSELITLVLVYELAERLLMPHIALKCAESVLKVFEMLENLEWGGTPPKRAGSAVQYP